jgi:hypothetical protein
MLKLFVLFTVKKYFVTWNIKTVEAKTNLW